MLKRVLVSVLCIFFLTGCSKQPNVKEISFASWGSVTEVKVLKKIISEFEKENPECKVNFIHIPQNYFQKIHLLFASNSAPDVIFVNNLYLPLYKKYLIDLSTYIDKDDYYSQAIEVLSVDNTLLAVPRDISNLILYVNTDIVQPKKPLSLERLVELFKVAKNKGVWGIGIEEDIFWLLPFLNYYGEVLSKDFKVETSMAFTFYFDLRDKYNFSPTKSQIGSLTLAQMFLDEKLAIYLSGRWMYPKIKESAKFNWEVMALPIGEKPLPCDASGWAITKSSKNKEASLAFIKYLSSNSSAEYFAKIGLVVPARISSSCLLNNSLHNEKAFLDVIKTSEKTLLPQNYKKIADQINTKF